MKNSKGITLTSLIITIIVMVILAGIALLFSVGDSGVILRAENTKFLEDLKLYKEELELYKAEKQIKNQANNEPINKGIGDDLDEWNYDEIKNNYIPSMKSKYEGILGIVDGELTYKDVGNSSQASVAESAGLKVVSEKAKIAVKIQGQGTVAGLPENGDTKIGSKINLKAIAGQIEAEREIVEYTFAGWYENGILISENENYSFEVVSDAELTAKFKTNATVIYYLENDEDKIKLDTATTISGYRNDATITKVEFQDGVKIAQQAFNGCTNLIEVIIGDNVIFEKSPGYLESVGTFGNCTKLKTVSMGKNISINGSNNYLKSTTFYGSTALETITVESISEVGDYAFAAVGPALKGNIIINEGIEVISNSAFNGCTNIENVKIPSSVTSIGASAFNNCTGTQTNIEILGNLKSIGNSAFKNCTGIRGEWIILDGTILESNSFYNCTNLEKIKIGNDIKVPHQLFNGCTNLIEVIIGDNVIFEKSPGYLESVGTFGNCTKLKTVSMGKNISINGSNNYLKSTTFYGSTALETITVESISEVGDYAFAAVGPALKGTIKINSDVTSIGSQAFYKCTSLEALDVDMTQEIWNSIEKGSGWNTGTNIIINFLK